MTLPVHVLFFTGSLGTGGSETHLTQLMTGLDRDRVRPELLLLRAARESPRIEEVRRARIPVHDLSSDAGRWGGLRSMRAVRAAFRRIRPDVIHSYGYPCDIYAPLLASRRQGSRVVTSRRGNQPRRRRLLLYRLTNRLAGHVVCVSRSAREYANGHEGLRTGKCTVIPNGVDLGKFRPKAPTHAPLRVLGTHGRVGWIKGTDHLVRAFSELSVPDAVLQIAGPTVDAWSRDLRATHEHREGLRFLGDITDAGTFLRSLDIFVLPSRSEGMSMALLEAMATGLPIVATDVGSNREVLDNGEAGLVVPPDSRSIADAVARLMKEPERARRLGAAARQRVEAEFRLKTMVRRFEAFYEQLCTEGGMRPSLAVS